jgi:hypothetical protein
VCYRFLLRAPPPPAVRLLRHYYYYYGGGETIYYSLTHLASLRYAAFVFHIPLWAAPFDARSPSDLFTNSWVCYTCTVAVVSVRIVLDTKHWTALGAITYVLSAVIFFACSMAFDPFAGEMSGVMYHLLVSPQYWLTILFVVGCMVAQHTYGRAWGEVFRKTPPPESVTRRMSVESIWAESERLNLQMQQTTAGVSSDGGGKARKSKPPRKKLQRGVSQWNQAAKKKEAEAAAGAGVVSPSRRRKGPSPPKSTVGLGEAAGTAPPAGGGPKQKAGGFGRARSPGTRARAGTG